VVFRQDLLFIFQFFLLFFILLHKGLRGSHLCVDPSFSGFFVHISIDEGDSEVIIHITGGVGSIVIPNVLYFNVTIKENGDNIVHIGDSKGIAFFNYSFIVIKQVAHMIHPLLIVRDFFNHCDLLVGRLFDRLIRGSPFDFPSLPIDVRVLLPQPGKSQYDLLFS
jgi:hypothetical protein